MARQQSGGVVRGGGLDPYVTAMSQQRSAQGHDMRKAAMQEQGATQRQGMQGDAAVAQSNIQAQAQAAAQKRMLDAQSAEAELGRVHETKLTELREETSSQNMIKRDKILDDLEVARENRLWDKVKESTEELRTEARYDELQSRVEKSNQASIVRNVAATQQKSMTAQAKLASKKAGDLKKFEEMRGIAATATTAALTSLNSPIFDYKGLDAISTYGKFKDAATNLASPVAALLPGVTMKGLEEEHFKNIEKANDNIVAEELNKVLSQNGVGQVSIEMLTKSKIREVEDLISAGKMIPEDFVPLQATLSSAQKTFTAKAEIANKGKGEEAQAAADFYRSWAARMTEAQNRLRQLDYAKTSIKNMDTIMVGSIAKQGNLWASEEFDDSWFEAQREAIENERYMKTEELGNPDSMPPIFISPDSPLISERDRTNPALMQRIQENYIKAATALPQYFPVKQQEQITYPRPAGRPSVTGWE